MIDVLLIYTIATEMISITEVALIGNAYDGTTSTSESFHNSFVVSFWDVSLTGLPVEFMSRPSDVFHVERLKNFERGYGDFQISRDSIMSCWGLLSSAGRTRTFKVLPQ